MIYTDTLSIHLDGVARDGGDTLAEALDATGTRSATEISALPGERADWRRQADDDNRPAKQG